MRIWSRRVQVSTLCAALCAGAIGVCATQPAQAQGKKAAAAKPDKKTRDAARKAYKAGEQRYKEAKYAEAFDSFKKAFDLIPTPHAQYWMAMSLDKQGKPVEAYAAFKMFMENPAREKAGEEKNATAGKRYEELKKTPGELNLVTDPAGAAVTIDGEAQMGETPMTVKLSPGSHQVEIQAAGYAPQTIEVTVDAFGKTDKAVTLTEEAPPPSDEPVRETVAPPPEPDPEPEPEPKSMVPAYVTLGLAGAGLIVGGIFGAQALGAKSDYDDNPTSDAADDVERNALIADMAFGVAITLGITGVVLLTSGGSQEPQSANKKLPKRAKLQLAPYFTPTGGGAAARFTF